MNCLNSLFLQTFEQKQKEEKRDSRNSWESEMSVDSLTSVNSILSEEGSVTSVGSFSDVAVGGAEQTDAVGADRKAYDSLRKKSILITITIESLIITFLISFLNT